MWSSSPRLAVAVGEAYDYWRDVSYGFGGLQGTQVFGWFDLGRTRRL